MNIKKIAAVILTVPCIAAGSVNIHTEAADESNQFLLESRINTEQQYTVDLLWNDISTEDENFSYQLFRQKEDGEWETRSVWNGSENVNVLNIYPEQPYLETWMTTTISESEEPAGKGIFNIDSVYMNNFNASPEEYLLDETGNWKYDVLFFGSSDCNSYKDLNETSYGFVQSFVDSGRGVLFGHDTICSNFGHFYFCKFAEQLGLLVKNDTTVNPATSVSVVNIGTLTNFPWTIRGTLTIPSCHSYGQYVGGTLPAKEWLTLNTDQLTDSETGSHSNFYLATYGNLGMIQTGHSNGAATDDERKVFANTLFYLYQISRLTEAKDNSFYDTASPYMPAAVLSGSDEDAFLTVSADDKGTEYNYYISARADSGNTDETTDSNIVSETAVSGIKGYVYSINQNPEQMSDLVEYDENNEIVQNVTEADENGKIRIPAAIYSTGKYYLHAVAVDNENNVSEELVVALDDESIAEPAVVTTDIAYVTTVSVNPINTQEISSTASATKTSVLTSTESHTTTVEIRKNTGSAGKSEKSSPETGDIRVAVYLFGLITGISVGIISYYHGRKRKE